MSLGQLLHETNVYSVITLITDSKLSGSMPRHTRTSSQRLLQIRAIQDFKTQE